MAIFLSRIKKVLNLGTKSITSNGTYNASSDGYDGYSQVTVNVSGGGGTSITPSNASPVALTANNTVTPTAAGYAIESYSEVVPSSNLPKTLTAGNIYKPTANGYAISSYTTITPSDSNPVALTGGAFYRIQSGSSGYAYATQQQSLKNLYRNKVLNGGFSVEIPLSVTSDRMTINEGGKIVIDTTNKIAYFYIDMTALSGGASSNWRQYGTFSSDLANYLPKGASNNRNTMTFITNDGTSDKKDISFLIGYVSSSYPRAFGVGYGVTNIVANDRFYVYGSWSY